MNILSVKATFILEGCKLFAKFLVFIRDINNFTTIVSDFIVECHFFKENFGSLLLNQNKLKKIKKVKNSNQSHDFDLVTFSASLYLHRQGKVLR
jgi:hypothetical protein